MNLPARRDPPVLEGQVVDEPARTVPRQAARVVAAAVRHDRTRAAARNAAYVGIGAAVITRRLWESRSTARYERSIRSAEAAGDHEAALAWDTQRVKFLKDRHDRRADLVELPLKVFKALPGIGAGFLGILAVIGVLLAISGRNAKEIAVPVRTVAHIAGWAALAFSVAWGPFLLALPWIVVLVLYLAGRSYANRSLTAWSAAGKDDGEDPGLVVTADTIVLALQHLPNPALKAAFKNDWRPVFHTMPVRDGRGYSAVFSLPLGVTAGQVADQRPVLARNVHRAEVEVWPSDAEKSGTGPAGTVAVWIADKGVLSKPAPEYPLLHEGAADVFEGVPGGVSPRGDVIAIPVVANNLVVGGQMGNGKSNACRVVMLGAALDPLAELWVHVFAYNGDFDAYAPRLARYVKGAEDEHVAAAVASLAELYDEVGRREQRLADLGAKKMTRQLAQQHPDLRPKLALFSECFPAGTMVGEVPIEQLLPDDVVPSWDEETGQPCMGVVLQVFRRPASSLVRLRFWDGTSLTCTPNHPLMTPDGWKDAGSLPDSSTILCWSHEQFAPVYGSGDTGDVRDMHGGVHDHRVLPGGQMEGGEARVLLSGVPDCGAPAGWREEPDGHSREGGNLTAHDGAQSDGGPCSQGQVVGDAQADGAQAAGTRRRDCRADSAAEAPRGDARLADGSDRAHESAEAQGRPADVLRAGYRQPGTEGGGRGGRRFALQPGAAGARRPAGSVASWLRVDRVEVLEPGSDGRYGGVCPDGLVYNLEVAGTHVYRVGERGIVAHNCHELFSNAEHGELAADLAMKTMRRARKTGVWLGFDTQSSRKDAIPPKIVELVSVNCCFYVKTWRSNDGFLGDGSFAAGIRATELRPGRDVGTSLATGVSDAQFELLRWYFVEVNDDTGFDAAADVIARAVAQVAPGTPVAGGRPRPAIESRDLLDDLDEVLGTGRVKLRDVVGLLRALAPGWGRYQRMTAKQLAADLGDLKVRTVNSSGTPWLDPAEVHRVIADRSTEDLDEED